MRNKKNGREKKNEARNRNVGKISRIQCNEKQQKWQRKEKR